jgi:hypothetical protein
MNAGKPSKALTMFQKTVHIYRTSLGDDHLWTACAQTTLAASFLVSHDPAKLVKHCDTVLSAATRPWGGSVRAKIRALIRYYKQYGYARSADHYAAMLAADSTRTAKAASP